MKHVTVTALRDFTYRDKNVTAGEVFQMPALDASIAMRNQQVSGSRHPGLSRASLQPDPEPTPEPTPEPQTPVKSKRRYRRRDLVAESA